ncbi:1258_t:CDS:2, partial [Dentiscutata erythropus]
MKSVIFCIFFALFLNLVSAHYKLLTPPPRSGAVSSYGAPCGLNYTDVNQTTISSFPVKGGIVTVDMLHATAGTLILYFSNDDGKTFAPLTDPTKYNITDKLGQNLTIPVDLSKVNATVGKQGILQSVFLEGNETSPSNTTLYDCADVNIAAENTTAPATKSNAGSINAPRFG